MSEKPLPPSDENRERVSDAEALFHDTVKPKPKAKPKVRPVDSSTIGQYEVEDLAPSRPEPPKARASPTRPKAPEPRLPPINPFDDPWGLEQQSPSPQQQVRARPSANPTGQATSTKPKTKEISPSEAVEEVWTRSAEWGATIASMVVEAVLGLSGVYYLLSVEEYGWAFVALALAGLLFVFLSYPLTITLERPVRITPEQAVKDYFDSLSHHFPHYIRMWLLLSTAGKVSPSYASFDGFRRHWRENIAKIRKGRASIFTPLKFQIQDFKSEKSAGKTVIEATFTVRILVRGRQVEGPIESFRMSTKLVKGPDRMWYLNKGTIR